MAKPARWVATAVETGYPVGLDHQNNLFDQLRPLKSFRRTDKGPHPPP